MNIDEPSYMIGPRSATLYTSCRDTNGEVHTISSDHPNFDRAVEAISNKRYLKAIHLMKPINAIKNLGYGFTVENNQVLDSEGDVVNNLVCTRIVDAIGKNLSVDFLVNFLVKLRTNPSYQAQQELYKFLETNGLPICPNGDFVAYKRIRDDWTDVYTGKINNRVGAVVTMDRGLVDDDSGRTCSYGLHVCGFQYLMNYSGAKLVAVKINPRDVVSVPTDYHGSKMRCCRYVVHKELDISLVGGNDVLADTFGKLYVDGDEDTESFQKGYVYGYECGESDTGTNYERDTADAIEDYDMGYDEGYTDAIEGNPARYI